MQSNDQPATASISSMNCLIRDVSVVICARNAEETLKQCLESVKSQNPQEIVVIDGDSTDGTFEITSNYTDRIFSDERKGLAYARQLGAEKAKGNYVAYVDSDVIVPPDCLETAIKELKQEGYAGIHAQIVSMDSSNYWEEAHDRHTRMNFNKVGDREWIGAIVAVFERETILKYRFDPFFLGAAEDLDFSRSLRKHGFRLGISSAYAYHQHRATCKDFVKQRSWYGRGNARYFWKHKSVRMLLNSPLLIPYGIFVCLKQRSLYLLPFYWVWSISEGVGTIAEISGLILRRQVRH